MIITLSNRWNQSIESINIDDSLVDPGEVAAIVAAMVKDYQDSESTTAAIKERRERRQRQVTQNLQAHEDKSAY